MAANPKQKNETIVSFILDGKELLSSGEETILQAAKRQNIEIPHLCYKDGYRSDGNCRACMVEVEGERVLAASCIRKPTSEMKVFTSSERAKESRKLVFELLLADQPKREISHDKNSNFWKVIYESKINQNNL